MKDDNEMLEMVKKITNDNNTEIIDINDTFKFKCQQCGQCCMHRHDIILNPFDVYNGAKYLGITTEEFIVKYLTMNIGSNSKIPMLILNSDEKTGFCPFLELDIKAGGKFKCSIHPAKPGACANHPIGVIASRKLEDELETDGSSEFTFIKVGQCENSKCDNDVLVKDWVKPYTDNANEIHMAHELQTYITNFFMPSDYFKLCTYIINSVESEEAASEMLQKLKDSIKDSMKTICLNTIGLGYAEYDISKPFLEQAQQNKESLKEFYSLIRKLYDFMLDTFNIEEGHVDEFIEQFENMDYNDKKENKTDNA